MALIKDKGICIRSTDYSESSQILTFFTAASGKISLIAKGSRRAKSSFSAPIEICSVADLVYSLRENEKMGTLTEFNPTFFSIGIRKKLLAINCAFFAAELLNLFTKEHDPHPELFDESVTFLKRLDENPEDKILPFLIMFEISLLTYAGSLPMTDICANCKRKFDANWKQYFFSITAGGLVCRDCEPAYIDKKMLPYQSAMILNQPQKISDAQKTSLVQIEELLIEYMTYVLEKKPRTADMILRLIKNF
ncbi:MAG: DNA repair protein RecO [Planctomycetes bacterium GWF2_41_51]|nr:MAG: DNA repair protein RecO [Planctomycetes bacterium GWF2_41_51]HBG28680.1 DNA repair protein RecO [Phycisphaerales bacterium]